MIITTAIMTIRYGNGFSLEATLLFRSDDLMRVAIDGSDNVVELTLVDGTWMGDDCEPVQVEFAYTRQSAVPTVTEDDCLCSREFAATLIQLLLAGENEPEAVPARHKSSAPISYPVV